MLVVTKKNWSRFGGYVGVALLGVSLLSGCGAGGSSDENESHSEIAAASLSGAANGTENNGSFVASHPSSREVFENALHDLLLIPVAFAHAAAGNCKELRDTIDCSATNGIVEIALDLCKRGRGEWSGTEKLAYDSVETCQARTSTKGVPTSGSVTRTFVGVYGDSENPATYRQMGPRRWSLDTTTAYGYTEPVSGGTLVQFSEDAATSLPLRTIQLKGIRIVSENVEETSPDENDLSFAHSAGEESNHQQRSRKGRKGKRPEDWDVRYDESISTDVDHPIQVRGSGADKVVLAGSITKIQNNELQFTATSTVVEELKFKAGCCHPASGVVKTEFTVDKDGVQREPETLTFTAECGRGDHKSAGASVAKLLKPCF